MGTNKRSSAGNGGTARPAKATKRERAAAARAAAIRRKRLRGGAVAAVAVAVLAVVGFVAFRGSDTGAAKISRTAFSLPELNGAGHVDLAQFRGKPTVVNFFASWCSACDSELPGFKAEADALKGKVTFVGVDSLETGDKNYMPKRHRLAGSFAALAQDVGGANGSGLHDALGGGNSMPLTAFYDAQGKLLDVQRTALVPQSALADKINELYHVTT